MSRIFVPNAPQRIAIPHILNQPRNAVWLDMGLGKTGASLEAIAIQYALGEINKVLVVAPKRVAKTTWAKEVTKWENFHHLTVVPIIGTAAQRREAVRRPGIIYTINYENLKWLIEGWGRDWPYDKVLADESTRLKSFRLSGKGGKRARALGKVAHSKVHAWSNLTGTPAPNGLLDLWGQTWFLDKGERLGRTYTDFKRRWFHTSPDGFDVRPTDFAQDEIESKLKDICLSLRAEDFFDLDEPIQVVVPVPLPPKALELYRRMEREMFLEINDHEVEAFSAAAKTMKCLQLASGVVYVDEGQWEEVHDAKLDALEDIIEEAAGMPVLVAYHFKSDLARLQKRFPKGVFFDDNPKTLADFQAGRIPILFLHPASAGHGVDGLQDGTNRVVFFSHWWDLEQHQQAIERVGPMRQRQSGFNRSVYIYYIVAEKTLDTVVMKRRDSKREVQDLLMEAMNGYD